MLISALFGRSRILQSYLIVTRKKGDATDPIQKLFLDKVREYKQKSVDGKLVDPSPAIEKELKTELAKLQKNYGGGPGVDMMSFPTFKFEEGKVDPIDEPVAPPPKKKEKKK